MPLKRKTKAAAAAASSSADAAAGSAADAAPADKKEGVLKKISADQMAGLNAKERRKLQRLAMQKDYVEGVEEEELTKVKTAKAERIKKRKAEEPEDEPSDDEENEDDEDGESEEQDDVDVPFEFFNPEEADYHSVGDLIKNGTWEFVFQDLNFAELADSIVGQGNIGTLVKSSSQDDPEKDETVCGLLTALNLRQFDKLSWTKTISEALLAKAAKQGSKEVLTTFQQVLGQQRKKGCEVGLLLSERFANLPPQLIVPLHRSIIEDIEWSCGTPECPEDERPFYFFTHFVGVARCFERPPADESADGPPPSKKKKGKKGALAAAAAAAAEPDVGMAPGGPWFSRPEDEVYFKKASASFTFQAGGAEQRSTIKEKESDGRGKELRAVFVLTREAFEKAIKDVEKAFPAEEVAMP